MHRTLGARDGWAFGGLRKVAHWSAPHAVRVGGAMSSCRSGPHLVRFEGAALAARAREQLWSVRMDLTFS